MATTKLIEPTETPAKASPKSAKERYSELLSSVQAKVLMLQTNPAAQAEFSEFAELVTYADKL